MTDLTSARLPRGWLISCFVLLTLSGCTSDVVGSGSPASSTATTSVAGSTPSASGYAGGPTALATALFFRPTTASAAPPVAVDGCPADPQAAAADPVLAPDADHTLCYSLGPTVLEVRALADLRIVDGTSQPSLLVTLGDDDAATFADYTRSHQGQQVAIVADGVVVVAPVIQAAISGPIAITGAFTTNDLEQLIDTLVNG